MVKLIVMGILIVAFFTMSMCKVAGKEAPPVISKIWEKEEALLQEIPRHVMKSNQRKDVPDAMMQGLASGIKASR